MTCCMCNQTGNITTAYVEGVSFQVCQQHFDLWYKTREDIGLWAWCSRVTAFRPPYGKTWFADYLDSLAVSQ